MRLCRSILIRFEAILHTESNYIILSRTKHDYFVFQELNAFYLINMYIASKIYWNFNYIN